MRPATQDYRLIYADDQAIPVVIGISLGYDYTAEHEWGIDGLRDLLRIKKFNFEDHRKRIKEKELGSRSRVIRSTKNVYIGNFLNESGTTYYYLYIGTVYSESSPEEKIIGSIKNQFGHRLDRMIDEQKVATAWSANGLCFITNEKGLPEYFLDEMKKQNVFLGVFSTSNPFANGSLVLFVASEIPESLRNDMLEADIRKIKVMQADEKTGIKKRFAKKQAEWRKQYPHSFNTPWSYIALSPREAEGKYETDYDLVYWVNPHNQGLANFGWYTVEELENWLDEKSNGIVPEENWPKLKWQCKHTRFSMLQYEYKDFLDIKPKYHGINFKPRRVIKGTPKSKENDLRAIAEHILMIYYCDINDRVEILHEDLTTIISSREEDRVFGFCEAMKLVGLGEFMAINTPKSMDNFSWLKSLLWSQAWFMAAKAQGLITDEDEEKFLK